MNEMTWLPSVSLNHILTIYLWLSMMFPCGDAAVTRDAAERRSRGEITGVLFNSKGEFQLL